MTKLSAPVLISIAAAAVGAAVFAASFLPEHPQPLVFDQSQTTASVQITTSGIPSAASASRPKAGGDRDSTGRKHGEWREVEADSDYLLAGLYHHGLREGIWTRHAPAGEEVGETTYRGGQRHGKWWASSEGLTLSGHYENNVAHGGFAMIQVNKANGWRSVTKGRYAHGEKVGVWQTESSTPEPTSIARSEEHYSAGRKTLFRSWHTSGQMSGETFYRDGMKHGVSRTWFPNGNQKMETPYEAGKKHGVEKSWFENGGVKSETDYRQGDQQGVYKVWDERGALVTHWVVKGKRRTVFLINGAAPGR